jgi:hypothetical protein
MLDRILRVLLVVLNLFLAITAVVGGVWVIPALPQEWFAGTPFTSSLIPALALTIIVGGGALTSAMGLVLRRWWAPLVSMVTGVAIAIFEVVETATMSLHFWLHSIGLESGPFTTALPIDPSAGIPIPMLLQPFYFVYGLVILGLGAWLWLRHPRAIRPGWMPSMLVLLAVGLTANVLLGPLGVGLLKWRVSPNGLNQTYGADGASLLLVVPAALVAARLWSVGHRLASPLALGVGLATVYYAIAETLGGDYLRYPGNNERFFLLFLMLITVSWMIAVRAWSSLDAEPPVPAGWLLRAFGTLSIVAGGLLGLAWIAQLVPIAVSGVVGPEYVDSPSAFWTIRIVDLGFIVPAAVWTGVGLWRQQATAIRAAYGLAAFLTLQGASVLAMGVIMLWRADPTATAAFVYILAPIVAALALLTVWLLRSYALGSSQSGRGDAARRPHTVPSEAPAGGQRGAIA